VRINVTYTKCFGMKYIICNLLMLLLACCSCKKPANDDGYYRKHIMEASVRKIKYLALGDSYTKGQSVSKEESFPFQLADSLTKDPYIEVTETRVIAQTGWTTTNLKNAIAEQSFEYPYDVVTLLIGVNNQYQGKSIEAYGEEFGDLLEKAIELAGNDSRKVTVISIPDYGFTPFGANNKDEISQEIDLFNGVNKQITDSMAITYIDITPISRSNIPGLVANDDLHPSGVQYKLWMDQMYPEIRKKILGK
jgi:acyl-CoA thioesterase-1